MARLGTPSLHRRREAGATRPFVDRGDAGPPVARRPRRVAVAPSTTRAPMRRVQKEIIMSTSRSNKNRSLALSCALVAPLVLASLGCDTPDDQVTDVQSRLTYATIPGSNPATPTQYDWGTQCFDRGHWTHCCPAGMAMLGAQLSQNVFKCANLAGGIALTGDSLLQRNNMLACPFGQVMTGYYGGSWDLPEHVQCGAPNLQSVTNEYVDGGTQDGFPMHVCNENTVNPGRFVMTGIQRSANHFTCGR
jgi:hypothetical protein